MKRHVLYLLVLSFVLPPLFAGEYSPATHDTASIENLFLRQLAAFPQEKIYVHTDKPVYVTGETMWMKIYLVDAVFMQQANASRYVYVELLDPQNEVARRAMIRPDSLGHFYGQLPIDETLPEGDYTLRAYTQYMRNVGEEYFFRRSIRVLGTLADSPAPEVDAPLPEPEESFDVRFFPEGGQALVAADVQVAFKAVNPDGRAEAVTGRVYDDTGAECAMFESEHLGMGSFRMYYHPERSYYAVCTGATGRSHRFDLPQPQQQGCALKVIRGRNDIRVAVGRTPGFELSPDTRLVAHVRGVVLYSEPWNEQRGYVVFDPEFFPAGVVHLLLVDGGRNILSERLLFSSQPGTWAKVGVTTDKTNYDARQRVVLDVSVQDDRQHPLSGHVSIAVVDRQDVAADSTVSILSTFLLTSELKGYIEQPMSYFRPGDRKAARALDVLMMTHGWRRYSVPALLKGELTLPGTFAAETSQRVAGKASGFFTSTTGGQVSLIAIRDSVLGTMVSHTDKDGRFEFREFEYPDSTWYIVQALTRRGSQRTFIALDEEDPLPEATLPPILPARAETPHAMRDYVKKSHDKYYLEHGMRVVNLAEVEVVASAVPRNRLQTSSPYYSVSTSKVITEEDVNRNPAMQSIFDLLRLLPGVTVSGDQVQYRQQTPLLILDNIPMEGYDYNNIMVGDVGDAFVARAESVMPVFGTRAANGAIVINTKRGVVDRHSMNKNIQTLRPIGYQQTVEFYSPSYATEADKARTSHDFRTTIFWKPDVLVDATGRARVTFYTADAPTTYGIVIEGVGDAGHLIFSDDQRISRSREVE